ncbi:acyl carrier protein [Streptomyces sp. NPDC020799]|uniref:acyl carrier protein n=1 Tax=Streptomyces sp. NPDC020799 TaxID=3365091 RepID=UPI0037B70E39
MDNLNCSTWSSSLDLISRLLVEKFEVDLSRLQIDTPIADLLVDSLMIVEMAIAVQDTFGVKVTEDELRKLDLGEFAVCIDERRSGR